MDKQGLAFILPIHLVKRGRWSLENRWVAALRSQSQQKIDCAMRLNHCL